MEYLLIMNETDDDFARRGEADYWSAWSSYIEALGQADIVRGGAGLEPPHTATTVRTRNGELVVEDGPFADSKEQLGGYFVIDVENLDEALDWAQMHS